MRADWADDGRIGRIIYVCSACKSIILKLNIPIFKVIPNGRMTGGLFYICLIMLKIIVYFIVFPN